jgi:hypothetical protein
MAIIISWYPASAMCGDWPPARSSFCWANSPTTSNHSIGCSSYGEQTDAIIILIILVTSTRRITNALARGFRASASVVLGQ